MSFIGNKPINYTDHLGLHGVPGGISIPTSKPISAGLDRALYRIAQCVKKQKKYERCMKNTPGCCGDGCSPTSDDCTQVCTDVWSGIFTAAVLNCVKNCENGRGFSPVSK